MASSLLTLKVTKVSSPFGPWEARLRPGTWAPRLRSRLCPLLWTILQPEGLRHTPVLQRFSASPEGAVVTLRPKAYQSQLHTISNRVKSRNMWRVRALDTAAFISSGYSQASAARRAH